MSAPNQPTVAIVLCTFNGSKHLEAQLDSLALQDWPIAVFAFDDVSSDNTIELLNAYTNKLSISIHKNSSNIGYVANFENGIAHVLEAGFDYIALSDQDDIWDTKRISSGMQSLLSIEQRNGLNSNQPLLAHSDLKMVDQKNELVHASFLKYRHYEIGTEKSLPTVLGQNGVMGNTILMNRHLAQMALPFPQELHVHDYWLAVLAELYGQRILLPEALVSYRIHDANASNSNDSIKFGPAKVLDGKSWQGFVTCDYRLPFKEDSRIGAIHALNDQSNGLPALTPEQKNVVQLFLAYLEFKQPRLKSFLSMRNHGFFRKGFRHRCRLAYSTLLTNRYNK